jgi:hypothetical protein
VTLRDAVVLMMGTRSGAVKPESDVLIFHLTPNVGCMYVFLSNKSLQIMNSNVSVSLPHNSTIAVARDSHNTVVVSTTTTTPTDSPTATYAGGSLSRTWRTASREAVSLKELRRF